MIEEIRTVTILANAQGFVRAMSRASAAMHSLGVAVRDPRSRRLHKRRCAICSPMSNPKPLSINGAAYRARTRRRRA